MFNTRKMSPVFTPGAEPDVPPVFVDRFGAKAWTSHVGGQDNKVEHALMLQQIQTVDENGQPVSKVGRLPRAHPGGWLGRGRAPGRRGAAPMLVCSRCSP